jgi:AbrB family looped-hinge helix DNA binding protein
MIAVPAQISTKYQVVIPKEVREALALQPHTTLLFLIDGDTVILSPRPTSFTKKLRGLHRDVWTDPDDWLEKERAAWE